MTLQKQKKLIIMVYANVSGSCQVAKYYLQQATAINVAYAYKA